MRQMHCDAALAWGKGGYGARCVPRRSTSHHRASRQTGIGLLFGTTNTFAHRRYVHGAATNPDPLAVAHAAAQVRRTHSGPKKGRS